ncbi:response regulator transcription factor [Candidatus Chloroploca sp. M-50]|uniref:Response regulator transcription factor n=1 Tax=Candidatus Chloroploca mongolica TaxID=2528176 RepID=A0ABS4DFT5_9CHLR|nr:response regulator transcription factor [Candidatus Chloroploca mongolica]MBP1468285.1 response regulator transcription factor [Candidatus Chloroploca mongolica]
MTPITVFLVDDHMVLREGLKTLIAAQADMNVIGEASDGEDAWEQIAETRPNVVIMDISMPGGNGIKATERIKQTYPEVKVLVLSIHDDTSYLRQMLTVGASGYILKHTAADALIRAIRIVAAGGVYLEPSLAEHVVSRYVQRPSAASDLLGAELSEREREVVQGVVQGYSNKDIANQLSLSVKTVETYRARALEKLGLTSRSALVRYALERGWLETS